MKKFTTLLLAGILLSACGGTASNDTVENSLCDCVKAGEEANQISASFFEREATQKGKDSLDAALEKRDRLCAQYQFMLADELQEKAAECDELQFSAED